MTLEVQTEKAMMADAKDAPISPNESHSEQEAHDIDAAAERSLVWKCDIHIVPVLFVLYALSFLDRINIGNAKIQGLMKELNMTGTQYNVALLIFFVPYILLEVPSNLILRKVAPSTWLSLLIFLWGVAGMCQGLVKSYSGLVVCRFFLGTFEAGVFPGKFSFYLRRSIKFRAYKTIGCAYLISMYYKRHELSKRWTVFFSSGLVAGAFGGVCPIIRPFLTKLY
jgi:MFS family permease